MKCSVCHTSNSSLFISTKEMMMDDVAGATFSFYRCDNCESVFLEAPIKEQDLGKYYPSYYLPYRGEKAWGSYAGIVKRSDNALNLQRVTLVSKFLPPEVNRQNASILDLGCGKPDFLYQFQKVFSSNCYGIDFKADQWAESKYDKLNLVEANWSNYTTSERFDVITAWHYLEHDYHPSATIDQCFKLLKPGGVLIIEVPMYQGLLAKIQKEHWQGWHTPRHITLFSFKSWSFLFSKANWNIIEHRKYGTLDPFILWWLGRAEKKKIQWNANFEKHFLGLALLKGLTWPLFFLEKYLPLGIQTIIVQKTGSINRA